MSPPLTSQNHAPSKLFAGGMSVAAGLFTTITIGYCYDETKDFFLCKKKLIERLLLNESEIECQKRVYLLTKTATLPLGMICLLCALLAINEWILIGKKKSSSKN